MKKLLLLIGILIATPVMAGGLATLINPYGDKVVVEVNSQTAQEYFGENFALYEEETFGSVASSPALFRTNLASKLTTTGTSMTLVSVTTRDGTELSGSVCFTIDGNLATAEYVCGTASSTSITALERGLGSDGTTEYTALKFPHRYGAEVKITDFPILQRLTNIINGDSDFPNSLTVVGKVTATSTAPTLDGDLANKKYVDDTAIAGVSVASGDEINTGTSEVLVATPKGIADSDLAFTAEQVDVSEEGLVLGMNFNSENNVGTAGSETVLDSSTYNNHGTNSGATATSTGGFNGGGAFSFDGTNDYITSPTSASLASLNDKQTWNFWFKSADLSTGDNEAILSSRGTGAFMYVSTNSGTTNLKVRINDGTHDAGTYDISVSNILNWNNIALVINGFNSTGAKIYVNGVLNQTVDLSAITSLVNTNAITVGKQSSGYFNGLIDNVKIYNRVLSADEIKAQYLQRAEVGDSYASRGGDNTFFGENTFNATTTINANILNKTNIIGLTASTTITGATTPQPVYIATSTGAVLLCDANDNTTYYEFFGFAISSGANGETIYIQYDGIVDGFTGLTPGANYYVQNTVGTIGTSQGTNPMKVGQAISATEIMISKVKENGTPVTGLSSGTTYQAYTDGTAYCIARSTGSNSSSMIGYINSSEVQYTSCAYTDCHSSVNLFLTKGDTWSCTGSATVSTSYLFIPFN